MEETKTTWSQTDTSSQTSPSKVTFTQSHPRSNFVTVLIGLLAAVCFGLGGFILAKSLYSPKADISNYPLQSPTSTPTTDPTANWKTYTDEAFNVSIKYPPDRDFTSPVSSYFIFKPIEFNIPEGVEAQIPGVSLSMLRFNYDESIQRLMDVYGTQNQEQIFSAGLYGLHIWGTGISGQAQGLSGGAFVLKNPEGNAWEFTYNVVDGINYEQEARLMMESLQLN